MTNEEILEVRKRGVEKALHSGHTKGDIANAIGVSAGSLWHTLVASAPHKHVGPLLDAWLKRNGFWSPDAAEAASAEERAGVTPAEMLATELRMLARVVSDPALAGEMKARWFRSTVQNLHDGLDEFAALLRKC